IKFAALALTLLLAQWIALVSPSFYPPLLCTPRMKLSKSFDKLHEYAQTASQTLAPYGDAFSTQFLDTSKQVYQMVMADVEDLHTQLEPKRKKLQQVLQEYVSKRHEDMDTLRAKLQTLVDEMRAKVEETKSKLIPIVEVYKEQLVKSIGEVNEVSTYTPDLLTSKARWSPTATGRQDGQLIVLAVADHV
uniref:Apolipoprotein A-I n=1 Tax=Oncorhynchus tshawytscha TaxID=74940 RepID=A0AAZ3QEI8_ONCTS